MFWAVKHNLIQDIFLNKKIVMLKVHLQFWNVSNSLGVPQAHNIHANGHSFERQITEKNLVDVDEKFVNISKTSEKSSKIFSLENS